MNETNPKTNPLTVLALSLALVLPLASCAAIQGQETAGEYAGDTAISAKVKASLIQEQALKAFQITVETLQGTVLLSGFVDTRAQKDEAGKIAAGISGVKLVQNNILVRTP